MWKFTDEHVVRLAYAVLEKEVSYEEISDLFLKYKLAPSSEHLLKHLDNPNCSVDASEWRRARPVFQSLLLHHKSMIFDSANENFIVDLERANRQLIVEAALKLLLANYTLNGIIELFEQHGIKSIKRTTISNLKNKSLTVNPRTWARASKSLMYLVNKRYYMVWDTETKAFELDDHLAEEAMQELEEEDTLKEEEKSEEQARESITSKLYIKQNYGNVYNSEVNNIQINQFDLHDDQEE